MTANEHRPQTGKVIIACAVLGVILMLGIGFVRIRPFDASRPGATYAGKVSFDGCGRFFGEGDPASPDVKPSDPRTYPWVADDPTQFRGSAMLTVDGVLTLTDDTHAVFTTDDGQRSNFHRGFCPTLKEQS